MSIQEHVYNAAQAKLARLCHSQWLKAKKNRSGRLLKPLQYCEEVSRLIEISNASLEATDDKAEGFMSEMTTGGIHARLYG